MRSTIWEKSPLGPSCLCTYRLRWRVYAHPERGGKKYIVRRALRQRSTIFSEGIQHGSVRPLPKNRLENKQQQQQQQNATSTGRKTPAPRYTARYHDQKEKKTPISDDLGSRLSPVIQKPFSPKNGIPLSQHAPCHQV